MTQIRDYQREFVEFALDLGVLSFGEFTLKSGRTSPYFFNAGGFRTGAALAGLGRFYADAIVAAGREFDVLMGPAYKGIPIAAATAVQLSERHGRDVPWCFNRKEAKDHGEGGSIVGTPLEGRVLVIDDVITAGTAIREVAGIVESAGAELVGVAVAVDRQERGQGIAVDAIVDLDQLIAYLAETGRHAEHLDAVRAYRATYGA